MYEHVIQDHSNMTQLYVTALIFSLFHCYICCLLLIIPLIAARDGVNSSIKHSFFLGGYIINHNYSWQLLLVSRGGILTGFSIETAQ